MMLMFRIRSCGRLQKATITAMTVPAMVVVCGNNLRKMVSLSNALRRLMIYSKKLETETCIKNFGSK